MLKPYMQLIVLTLPGLCLPLGIPWLSRLLHPQLAGWRRRAAQDTESTKTSKIRRADLLDAVSCSMTLCQRRLQTGQATSATVKHWPCLPSGCRSSGSSLPMLGEDHHWPKMRRLKACPHEHGAQTCLTNRPLDFGVFQTASTGLDLYRLAHLMAGVFKDPLRTSGFTLTWHSEHIIQVLKIHLRTWHSEHQGQHRIPF